MVAVATSRMVACRRDHLWLMAAKAGSDRRLRQSTLPRSGVALVLHQHRLALDHPIRATADADFGVPPWRSAQSSVRQSQPHMRVAVDKVYQI
jgi:hypothetical protein